MQIRRRGNTGCVFFSFELNEARRNADERGEKEKSTIILLSRETHVHAPESGGWQLALAPPSNASNSIRQIHHCRPSMNMFSFVFTSRCGKASVILRNYSVKKFILLGMRCLAAKH